MPALTITKTYLNGNILTQTDLDNAFNSISTLLNTTLLDSSNVQVGGLVGSNLANGTVGNAQIGVGAVGNAQIASSAISGDKLQPNILFNSLAIGTAASTAVNLSYNAPVNALVLSGGVQFGSSANSYITQTIGNLTAGVGSPSGVIKPIVVSAASTAQGLMLVSGRVNGSGVILSGNGFTTVRNVAGNYTITFSTAFTDVPAVVATADHSAGTSVGAYLANVFTTSFDVTTYNAGISTVDSNFCFIAAGTRSA